MGGTGESALERAPSENVCCAGEGGNAARCNGKNGESDQGRFVLSDRGRDGLLRGVGDAEGKILFLPTEEDVPLRGENSVGDDAF